MYTKPHAYIFNCLQCVLIKQLQPFCFWAHAAPLPFPQSAASLPWPKTNEDPRSAAIRTFIDLNVLFAEIVAHVFVNVFVIFFLRVHLHICLICFHSSSSTVLMNLRSRFPLIF